MINSPFIKPIKQFFKNHKIEHSGLVRQNHLEHIIRMGSTIFTFYKNISFDKLEFYLREFYLGKKLDILKLNSFSGYINTFEKEDSIEFSIYKVSQVGLSIELHGYNNCYFMLRPDSNIGEEVFFKSSSGQGVFIFDKIYFDNIECLSVINKTLRKK